MLPGDLESVLYPLLDQVHQCSVVLVGTEHTGKILSFVYASVSSSGHLPRVALGPLNAENSSKQSLCAAMEKRYRQMSVPWALSPQVCQVLP